MNHTLLNLFGLKWNPFAAEIPIESLYKTRSIEHFCWMVEHSLIRDGGFARITGEPGTGKSVTLRILAHRLSQYPDLTVGVLSHPSGNLGNFYRQMGDVFGIDLKPSNRWGGFKALRERWIHHQDSALLKPVLLIDEAQEMNPNVMNELRLLTSLEFDSKIALSIVFSGDQRLNDKLKTPELLPLHSRIRMNLRMPSVEPSVLAACLTHLMEQAGNKRLMDKTLVDNLSERAMGNFRALCTIANELLMEAAKREDTHISEKLYLELASAIA